MKHLFPFYDQPIALPGDVDLFSNEVSVQSMYDGTLTDYRPEVDRAPGTAQRHAMKYNMDMYFKRAASLRTDLPFHVRYLCPNVKASLEKNGDQKK